MDSFFHRISQSSNADAWRRFRLNAEQMARLQATVLSIGHDVVDGPHTATTPPHRRIGNSPDFLCFSEPAEHSPSPFNLGPDARSVAYTELPEAMQEFRRWVGDGEGPSGGQSSERNGSAAALAMTVLREERMAWLDLECQMLRSVESVNQLDLEGEPLFLSLSRAVRELLSPDLLVLQLETPSDFWPGRPAGWTWAEAKPSLEVSASLTARLVRLLHRRERVLFVEDLVSAPDIAVQTTADHAPFRSAFLLPMVAGTKALGVLELFYGPALVPLPGDIEALELFRRELSLLLDRSRTHLRMQRMATVDGLTNLFNHRFFREQLRTEFQRAVRYQKTLALIMIDIDDFKGYNDRYGHLAGDRVLAETARAIRGSVRDIDFVARYGGEEFALILPEVDASSGVIVAEKIRRAVEAQRFISEEGEEIGTITISCGVTDNRDAASPEEIIERADRGLYWVKRHGRNLVRLAGPGDHE
jgi:diguanylate cyclase (GGDEF)-like protein